VQSNPVTISKFKLGEDREEMMRLEATVQTVGKGEEQVTGAEGYPRKCNFLYSLIFNHFTVFN